ncbi:lipopolysaccharide biosynthesis protein [Eubacterium sp.]|uniref:lipopolysaccharide biosynthesis protein n=1 Tax=Eubacterium sp. TaxID=142586 RepID=UPI00399C302D
MVENNLRNKTMSGLFWRFLERCGAQGVNFIVQIVLARLIAPQLYGTIALVTVFTTILQIFVDSGMANALIQKKDADDVDFSSVFYFNMGVCVVMYLGMFIAAPYIAQFYKDSELVAVIRVMSLTLVISGIKNVQQAYVSRTMQFKRFFFATLGGTISAAVVGIAMAYKGYGVWALVAQDLVNKVIDTLVLWFTVKWRPKRCFSFKRLKGLISFGWKILASALIDTVYNNIRQLIIGKLYTTSDLGYYNRGKQLPYTVINNINTSIDSVLFPAMSSQQDDRNRVKTMTRRAIKTSSYIMWPIMIGLAFTSETVVDILLTNKWAQCVPYLRIFCISYAFYPIHTANLNAIKAMGRSDLFLKLEIIKKVVGIVVLLSTMWFGPLAMAYSLLFTSVISQIINSWPNKKLLNYCYLEQLKDIMPYILLSCVMGVCVYTVNYLKLNDILEFIIQVMLGAIVYIGGSRIFKFESFYYVANTLKNMGKK